MDKLIYYPSFFIEDEEWLRFALLYMSNVSTIVPEDADTHLNEIHLLILNETDLLTSYRPKYVEIDNATRNILEKLDKRINHPINRYRGFDRGFERATDFEILRTSANQNFELFSSKTSYELESFLKEHGFAKDTENGLLIADEIGTEYMSILANEIANENNLHVITDLKNHRARNTIVRNPLNIHKKQEEFNAINGFIRLNIPNGIKEIPIVEIIQLRNSQSYQKRLNEFQSAVNRLINQPNYQITENTMYDIQDNLYESKLGLASELSSLGVALVGTTIGISCSFNNALPLEVFREALGVGTVFSSCIPLYTRYQENRKRKLAASFVTDIKNLQRNRLASGSKDISPI